MIGPKKGNSGNVNEQTIENRLKPGHRTAVFICSPPIRACFLASWPGMNLLIPEAPKVENSLATCQGSVYF